MIVSTWNTLLSVVVTFVLFAAEAPLPEIRCVLANVASGALSSIVVFL